MIIDEDIIQIAINDPEKAALQAYAKTYSALEDENWGEKEYLLISETFIFIESMIEENLFQTPFPVPKLNGNKHENCGTMWDFLNNLENHLSANVENRRLADLKSKFKTDLGAGFFYEFSQGDLEKVQTLINALRGEISTCNDLEEEHKQRLLRRLEKLQSELHKKVSDLDRFWGLIGDAGVVLGKLGNDAKPLVDRIREIADIVWQTQARAEELPSGTEPPLLGHRDGNDAA